MGHKEMSRRTLIASVAGGVAAVAAGPLAPTEARAATVPYVGCNASLKTAHNPQEQWDLAQRQIGGGKLTYRRAFDSGIPAPGHESWRKANAPAHFYSVKPPNGDVQGVINGAYDDRLRALARGLPSGTKFTMYHEPEDNLSGPTFSRLFRRVYNIVKNERPTGVAVWYVAMAYQWETNSKGHTGTNEGWIDAAKLADGVGIDIYAPDWDFVAIEDDDGFRRWKKLVADPSGKPWGVIERGIDPKAGEADRAAMLKRDWAFTKAAGSKFFLYWQSTNGDRDWRLTGSNEQALYRTMAAEGRAIGA